MSAISLLTAHGRDHHPGLLGYSSGKLDLAFKMFDVFSNLALRLLCLQELHLLCPQHWQLCCLIHTR
jgi:hypothetical protein